MSMQKFYMRLVGVHPFIPLWIRYWIRDFPQRFSRAKYTNIWRTMLSLTFAGSHRNCATGRGDCLAVRSRSSGPTEKARQPNVRQSSGVDWRNVNVDEWRRRRPEHSSRPGISVLGSADIGAL